MRHLAFAVLAIASIFGGVVSAQTANLEFPIARLEQYLDEESFDILEAEPSRGLSDEVGLKAQVRFADGTEMTLKIRPAAPGASEFNNEPRFELAAYRLQSLFLDADDYVVPPTALRMLPRETLLPYAPRLRPTFRGSEDVLVVLQYWLQEVEGKNDILDRDRFDADAEYARRFGNFNLLTYLIDHGDSNYGNMLISTVPDEPRAWAVDNGVAFGAPESDRGNDWAKIRVAWLPAASVDRIRQIDRDELTAALAVLAEWRRVDDRFVPTDPGPNLNRGRGARIDNDRAQLGLTSSELSGVARRIDNLDRRVERGRLETR